MEGKLYDMFDKKTGQYIGTAYEPFRWEDREYQETNMDTVPVLNTTKENS